MRIIDADALFNWGKHKLSDAVKYGNKDAEQQHFSYSTMMMYEIADEIDNAPTIDAEPVRHGRWGESDEHPGMRVCSVCSDCYVCEEWLYDPKWHYCPNCGCRMDLEG